MKMIGAGKYIPDRVVTNQDFERLVDTSDEWILRRTGIRKRHLSNGELTWQMGKKAAERAIADAEISPEQIDMVIHTSVTADYYFPSMSNILIGKLGLQNAFGIDIACACAGFVYAMDMAQRYFDDSVQNILIVSAENVTKTVDYTDRSTCVLFGDGAGAVVVSSGGASLYSYLKVEGEGAERIYAHAIPPQNAFSDPEAAAQNAQAFPAGKQHYMHMDGQDVYKFTSRVIPEALLRVCERAALSVDQLDWVVPHQANLRIIEAAAKKLGLPLERFYVNIQEYGNISSACIPVCLCELREQGRLREGDKIGLVGFGSGLIYGAIVLTV